MSEALLGTAALPPCTSPCCTPNDPRNCSRVVPLSQDLFRRFYKRWQITALPDAYNYKPYW